MSDLTMTDAGLVVPTTATSTLRKRKPPAEKPEKVGPWVRPKTGSQFDMLPPTERATMTDLLAHRIKQFAIRLPKTRPTYDRIFVYPLDDKDQSDIIEGLSVTLYQPQSTKDGYGSCRGVLVKAGMKACDEMWGHGYELGHIVLYARLSPWERKYAGGGTQHRVAIIRASELVGSEDLEEDVIEGAVTLDYDDAGRLCIAERTRNDPPENDEV